MNILYGTTLLIPQKNLAGGMMHFHFLKHDLEQRRNLILNGPVSKTILLLSVPSLMMGLIQSAIPVIDGLFLNNLAGTIAASAVTYCTPIVNMSAALAQGLSVAGHGHHRPVQRPGRFCDESARIHPGRRLCLRPGLFSWRRC